MRRNKNWRWLAGTTAACVLVGALGIGGTIAYLTDNESTANTFTVGKIDVDLTEPNYPGNDSPDVKNLVPNQEVQKDPKVTNVGINDAIVFMSVEVPVKDVTVVGADDTKGAKEKTELFWFKDTADTQGTYANHFSDQWMELTSKGEKDVDNGDTNTYVFAYKTAVAKDATTDSLFDKIQLKNVIEGEVTAGEAQNVVVNTYAIQASEVLEGNTDLTDVMTEENLGKIYDIYFNQNPDKGGGSEDKPEIKQGTATLIDGPSFNEAMKTLSGNLDKIQSIKNADSVPEDAETQIISDSGSEKEAVMYFDAATGSIYIATNAEKISLNEQSHKMFKSCTALTDIDALAGWDVSHVYNINEMFSGCKSLQNIEGLSEWNTSMVSGMTRVFEDCAIEDVNALENWVVAGTRYSSYDGWGGIAGMFYGCTSLTNIDGLANWDVSNVPNFNCLFVNCNSLTNVDALASWDVSSAYNMEGMFSGCDSLTYISGLSNWDVSAVEDMNGLFSGNEKLNNVNALADWNTSSVTDMNGLLAECPELVDITGLSKWDTGKVKDMSMMFYACENLSDISALSDWNTENVTDMSEMFLYCSYLTDASSINDWDIENVTNFESMFYNCPSHPEFAKRPGTWSNGTFIPKN